MTRLQAQSAVLGRTTTEQNKLMKDYTNTVKGLRTEYGITTTEAAEPGHHAVEDHEHGRQSSRRVEGPVQGLRRHVRRPPEKSSEGLANSLTATCRR